MTKFSVQDFMNDDGSELPQNHKSGYVALIGKPNAGKSTLLNSLIGSRLSIISHKPQTTRNRIVGIYSDDDSQIVFLDTPGILIPEYKLHQVMMNDVVRAVEESDFVIILIDATTYEKDAELIKQHLDLSRYTQLVLLNKIDLVEQEDLDSIVKYLNQSFPNSSILPISALENIGLTAVIEFLKQNLPLGPTFYPKDQLSEHPERFFVSELVREQIFLQYDKEIPYSTAVDVIEYNESEQIDHIHADIIVERDSQKGILIGKGGKALKNLGIEARKTIEEFIGKQVNLKLFVKSRPKWRQKDHFLRGFGYPNL